MNLGIELLTNVIKNNHETDWNVFLDWLTDQDDVRGQYLRAEYEYWTNRPHGQDHDEYRKLMEANLPMNRHMDQMYTYIMVRRQHNIMTNVGMLLEAILTGENQYT